MMLFDGHVDGVALGCRAPQAFGPNPKAAQRPKALMIGGDDVTDDDV